MFDELFCVLDGGANVGNGHIVFTADFLECHPPAKLPRMRAIGNRVPRMTGLPCWISGSMTIRSFIAFAGFNT